MTYILSFIASILGWLVNRPKKKGITPTYINTDGMNLGEVRSYKPKPMSITEWANQKRKIEPYTPCEVVKLYGEGSAIHMMTKGQNPMVITPANETEQEYKERLLERGKAMVEQHNQAAIAMGVQCGNSERIERHIKSPEFKQQYLGKPFKPKEER